MIKNYYQFTTPRVRQILLLVLLALLISISLLITFPELPETDRSTREGIFWVALWLLNLNVIEICIGTFVVLLAYLHRPNLHYDDNASPNVHRSELTPTQLAKFAAEDAEDEEILSSRQAPGKADKK